MEKPPIHFAEYLRQARCLVVSIDAQELTLLADVPHQYRLEAIELLKHGVPIWHLLRALERAESMAEPGTSMLEVIALMGKHIID